MRERGWGLKIHEHGRLFSPGASDILSQPLGEPGGVQLAHAEVCWEVDSRSTRPEHARMYSPISKTASPMAEMKVP